MLGGYPAHAGLELMMKMSILVASIIAVLIAVLIAGCTYPSVIGETNGPCAAGYTRVTFSAEIISMNQYSAQIQNYTDAVIAEAAMNLDRTLHCAETSGNPPVTWTWQILSVEKLMKGNSPVPDRQAAGGDGGIVVNQNFYSPITVPDTRFSTAGNTAPHENIIVTPTAIPAATAVPNTRFFNAGSTVNGASFTSTPTPRTCSTERATLLGPEGALYFEWVSETRPCSSHESAGSVKRQDVPGEKEVFELFGTPRSTRR